MEITNIRSRIDAHRVASTLWRDQRAPFAPQAPPRPQAEHFTAPEFAAALALIAAFTLALVAMAWIARAYWGQS